MEIVFAIMFRKIRVLGFLFFIKLQTRVLFFPGDSALMQCSALVVNEVISESCRDKLQKIKILIELNLLPLISYS